MSAKYKEKVITKNASITQVTRTAETPISKPAAIEVPKEISKPLKGRRYKLKKNGKRAFNF